MSQTVVIGGARGFIGCRLSACLEKSGYRVIGISRSPKEMPCGKTITWNDVKKNGLPKCDAVVNLAGRLLMDPFSRWSQEFKNDLRRSRIETTNLLSKCISSLHDPPRVFVTASAISYYPASETNKYTEESVCVDDSFLYKLVCDWEKAGNLDNLKEQECQNLTRHVIVRIGITLGREGGVIKSSIMPFAMGLGGPIGSGSQWFPWIHVDDAVGIIEHAIKNDCVKGILNAVSPGICTNLEFTKAFAGALGRPAVIAVPRQALELTFGPDRAAVMTEGQHISPVRTLSSGYKFKYPDIKSACAEFAHLF